MDAKKCDRCKKFFMLSDKTKAIKPNYLRDDKKDKPDEMSEVSIKVSLRRTYYSGASSIGYFDDKYELDLCPDCATEVLKTLFNK